MKHIRETSRDVAMKIINQAGLMHGQRILEPSAGEGNLIDVVFRNFTFKKNDFNIDCVELNKEKCEILRSKEYNTYQQDFLTFEPKGKLYDRIIACPPFKNNIDLEHIMHMYKILRFGGIMVTLTSPLWIMNNEEKHVEFRRWLEGKQYNFQMLPDNSFMEKDRTVPTGILKIIK